MATAQIDSGPGELAEVSTQGVQIGKGCSSPGDHVGTKGVKFTSSPVTGARDISEAAECPKKAVKVLLAKSGKCLMNKREKHSCRISEAAERPKKAVKVLPPKSGKCLMNKREKHSCRISEAAERPKKAVKVLPAKSGKCLMNKREKHLMSMAVNKKAKYLHCRDENKERPFPRCVHVEDEDIDLLEDPILQKDLQEISKRFGHPVEVVVASPGQLRRIPTNESLEEHGTWDLSAVTKKANVTQDEMDSQEDDLSPQYNPDSEGGNKPWFAPDSPSTLQKEIEKTRKEHMTRASYALDYYHTRHPGECYNPEHVNLKHVIFMMDGMRHYIHMNFTARNVKDGSAMIFFAELCLKDDDIYEYKDDDLR